MKINNDLPDVKSQKPIDSSQLSYKENVRVENSVSMVTDKLSSKKEQYLYNEIPALKSIPKLWDRDRLNNNSNMSSSQNTINIQLLYNINQTIE